MFDEDFSLSDGIEGDFVGGDDIHALPGEPVLWHADVMAGHVDKESSIETASEEKHVDNVNRVEISAYNSHCSPENTWVNKYA